MDTQTRYKAVAGNKFRFNQPEQFMLLSDRNKFPLIPTSVYGNKYPKDYTEVARSISPERIIKTVESII